MTSSRNYDEYNINQYGDEELFNILGMNHPTDRELEAKIIMMINKYSNIQNEDAYRIAIFYQNIYKHFFDIEDEEPIVEGFGDYEAAQYKKNQKPSQPTVMNFTNPPIGTTTNEDGTRSLNPQFTVNPLFPTLDNPETNIDNAQNYYQDNTGEITTTQPKNLSTMADSYGVNANIIPTQLFDYSKNPSGTNPLLKQTIKRIISIDSQFRNKQFQPLSTNYTFNLSEPLKDVLSLKLYSINIPYTWYTISKAYGANLIYLKGNVPGINNSLHDYPITIDPGNYDASSFVKAINDSIDNNKIIYSDISFGETKIAYSSSSAKMTFTTNIQKVYNESYYQINFSNPDMSSYLGFKSNTYNYNTLYSYIIIPTENPIYNIDNSNNYFTIYRYVPESPSITNNGFKNNQNNYIASYKINLYDTDNNKIVESSNLTYSQIKNYINNGFEYYNKLNGDLFSSSGIIYNETNSQWNLTVNFNRLKLIPTITPNEKIAIVFPDYTYTTTNVQKINIWIYDNSNNDIHKSLFNFDIYNDLSIITGETDVKLDLINILDTSMSFICNRENYNKDVNNIIFDIASNGKQSHENYFKKINNLFLNNNPQNIIFTNTKISEQTIKNIQNDKYESLLQINMQFSKKFTSQNYNIIFNSNKASPTVINILQKYFGIKYDNKPYDLSTNSILRDLSYNFPYGNITDIKNTFGEYYLFSFYPNSNNTSGNQMDVLYDVFYIPDVNYSNSYQYTDLIKALQNPLNLKMYNSQTNLPDDIHYNKTNLKINITNYIYTNNYVTYTFDIEFNIINILTQDDYILNINYNGRNVGRLPDSENKINFIDYFGIDPSKNIIISQQIGNINNRIVNGKNDINLSQFYNANDSTIQFTSIYDLSGVGSQNIFIIKIPGYKYYYINSLISYINAQINEKINENSSLIGTFFGSKIINNTQTNIFIHTNINIIYTSKDYKLVFFDPYSFIKCIATANSIANATWDTTLGWTLGFRDFVDYILVESNSVLIGNDSYYLTSKSIYTYTNLTPRSNFNGLETNTLISIISDTTVSINVFNYFLIVLDDFIQNHLNDGLVTISKPETQLPAQSYSYMANKVCDPTSGQIVSLSTTNIPGNNLTQKQLYALNAIQIANKINYSTNYSKGPYVQDIFGIVPIKSPSLPGQTYVEFGGTLQNQERQYFGPVNIHRMSIQLVNDKGDIVDLNGSDWSFSLVCEQLYNTTS